MIQKELGEVCHSSGVEPWPLLHLHLLAFRKTYSSRRTNCWNKMLVFGGALGWKLHESISRAQGRRFIIEGPQFVPRAYTFPALYHPLLCIISFIQFYTITQPYYNLKAGRKLHAWQIPEPSSTDAVTHMHLLGKRRKLKKHNSVIMHTHKACLARMKDCDVPGLPRSGYC